MPEWIELDLDNLPSEHDEVLAIDAEGNIGIGVLLVAGMKTRDWMSYSVEENYGTYCVDRYELTVLVCNVVKYIPVEAFRNERSTVQGRRQRWDIQTMATERSSSDHRN